MAPKRDWQSLGKKLRRGVALEEASTQCGIPIEEARTWAREEIGQLETESITLHKTSLQSLEIGFRILEKIANGGMRPQHANNADLDAAKELVRAAIALQRVAGIGIVSRGQNAKGQGGQRDLFDAVQEATNWDNLLDPNKI